MSSYATRPPRIKAAGFSPVTCQVLPASVYAASPEELYDALTFFFFRDVSAYQQAKDALLPSLERLAKPTSECWELEVQEILYEIR